MSKDISENLGVTNDNSIFWNRIFNVENTSTILVFISWIFLQAVSSEIKSSVVMKCANTTEGYEEGAKLWNCTGTLTYHCVLDIEDNFRELRIDIAAIGYGYCPKLQKANTTTGYTFEWKPCKEELGPRCPKRTSTIYSNEVYKFSGCLHSSKMKSSESLTPTVVTMPTETTTTSSLPSGKSAGVLGNATADVSGDANAGVPGGVVAVVIVLVIIVVMVIVALLLYFLYYRRKKGNRTDETILSSLLGNKSCLMEEKTNFVTERCKQILDSGQMLVCIGALGSGKTTILKQLADMFENEWKILKLEDFEQFKDSNKKYMWILDDIFGKLSYCNNEEQIQIKIQHLEKIMRMCNKNRFKMVLSIRQDILSFVAQNLLKSGLTMDVDNCVYIDKLYSDNNHFANAIQNSKCDRPSCCCKHVSTRAGNLGSALILNMFSTIEHNDLFLLDVPTWDPLQALVTIFTNMLAEEDEGTINRSCRHVMIYIMLKGEYNPKKFDKDCAKEIDENLNKSVINMIDKPANTYITSLKDGDGRRRFKHEFYYIAAFHTCWKWRKELIIKFCSTDVIRQLCRIDHGLDLEVILAGENLQAVNDRLEREGLTRIERPRIVDVPSVSDESQKSES